MVKSVNTAHSARSNGQGPALMTQERNAMSARIPFILPQVLFVAGTSQYRMGQGLEVSVAFTTANSDVTIVHNMGHPVQNVWAVMAPAGVFIPKVKISTSANANTTKQVILQSDTISNPTTVVLF